MNGPPVLAWRGIAVRRRGRRVLEDATLTVRAGVCIGLVGPNGAGKTTLLDVAAGRCRPVAGEVRLDGTVLPPRMSLARRARLGLGYLAQGPTVFRRLTVWENLCAVPGTKRAACERILKRIGLGDLRNAVGATLSGGERRRLEIGRLLLLDGLRVLLCDEPFANLDPLGIEAVSELLREAADDGLGVVVTDHQIGSLRETCAELAVLLDGGIARVGATAEVLRDPMLRARYLGRGFGADPDPDPH